MAWAKLDDGLYRNAKVMALSDGAFRAWVNSISFSADNLKDGVIERQVARTFGWLRRSAELQAAGFWEPVEAGWFIHDYFKYNPSREQVEATRAATATRVGRMRNGRSNAVTRGVTNNAPDPDPDPDPQKEEEIDPLEHGGLQDSPESRKRFVRLMTGGSR